MHVFGRKAGIEVDLAVKVVDRIATEVFDRLV